jgi:hypothetical protein
VRRRDDPHRWDRGWDEHRLRQAARGLELSPAERLRWLEETLTTMRRWLGRARQGVPVDLEG